MYRFLRAFVLSPASKPSANARIISLSPRQVRKKNKHFIMENHLLLQGQITHSPSGLPLPRYILKRCSISYFIITIHHIHPRMKMLWRAGEKSFTVHRRTEWSATVGSSRGVPQKHPELPSNPPILFLCYKPRTEQRTQRMQNSHSQQCYSPSPKGKDDLLATKTWRGAHDGLFGGFKRE